MSNLRLCNLQPCEERHKLVFDRARLVWTPRRQVSGADTRPGCAARDDAPMPAGPDQLTDAARDFLTERHLATFSSLRADGTIHVTACGFTWDPDAGVARVITSGTSQKARNASAPGGVYAAVSQIDGPRWLTLEGVARTSSDAAVVADAEQRYTARYKPPRENPQRVAIELTVTRVLGSRAMLER